jgi:curved DNA-binding protein CbpA/membrane protein implicated in regulation of membrane protease activity
MDYKKDYYSILEVDNKATPEALRASYRRLAKLYHPDKNPGDPSSEERFKSVNDAYEVLSSEITRHIYDSYRENSIKEDQSNRAADDQNSPSRAKGSFKTRKKRTYIVKREKRIYVHGIIEVKFQGEPELSDNYARQWEQRFTIHPTEVFVIILSSNVYKDRPAREYEKGYSAVEIFTTPLKQPVNCKIISGEQEEYYQLDLYDIRVKNPVLKDITRYEQHSFGTLHGELLGYVLHQDEEEVTEEYAEYTGATGSVETKTEAGYVFTRQQFYAKDGSTYWGDWRRSSTGAEKYATNKAGNTQVIRKENNRWSDWWWLIVLLIIVIIWPPLLAVVLSFVGVLLVFFVLSWVVSAFDRAMPFLGVLIIGLIFLFAVRSFFRHPDRAARSTSYRKFDRIRSGRSIVQRSDNKEDTLDTHDLSWEDRDSSRYEIRLSMPLSAIYRSTAAHERMDEQQYAIQGINSVYRHMLDTDNDPIGPIALAFDSLAKRRSLARDKEASMVVSCIQSIPYSLIVDRSCSANYTESYIQQYLSRCEGDCCKGFSKFGVQSPVEFISDLKGDCDTRALLLYDILGKLGYKVALMTSDYYKHALIAVNLSMVPSEKTTAVYISGRPYYLWETTSKGFGPGELPGALSNINHWKISLIQ